MFFPIDGSRFTRMALVLVCGALQACSGASTQPGVASVPTATPKATPTAPAKAAPTMKSLSQQFVTWLSKGESAKVYEHLGDKMTAAMPRGDFDKLWPSLEAQFGAFTKQTTVKERDANGIHAVIITCVFETAVLDAQFAFDDDRKVVGFFLRPSADPHAFGNRPQTPKPPFPYEQREVLYDNATDNSKLGGTLTLPKGDGPHPVVLLITGSGAQDRDETIFGHKPFFVIADHLTRKGIAVLRVDDRGIGKTTGNPKDATIETHATDVEAGIAFLKKQKEIDPKRIGLVGHSEGGIIAPVVASRSKDVAFIVSLAGSVVPGSELNPLQVEAILRAKGGTSDKAIKAIVAEQRRLMAMVAQDAPRAQLETALEKALTIAAKVVGEDAPDLDAAVAREIKMLTSPWFVSFVKLDPRDYWSKVTVPVKVMIGAKDLQVPAGPNIDALVQPVMRAGNVKNMSADSLEDLNHLFQKADTGLVEEYATIEETFNTKALDMMTTWLLETTGL